MSKLFAVLADQLAEARFDDRLSKDEGALLEAMYVALDAFGRGKDVWAYERENAERVAREEASLPKRRVAKSQRAKPKRRNARGRVMGSRHQSTQKTRSNRRAA